MLHAMLRHAKMQTFEAHRLCQLSDHIAMRPHLDCAPVAYAAVVHREAVMMFRDRHNVFRARFFKQLGPGGWIEMFGFEHRYELFVSELVWRPIRCDVVLIFAGFSLIHASGIPFIAESRNGVDSPMHEDPELRVPIPLRHRYF